MQPATLAKINELFRAPQLDEILINGCHNMELIGVEGWSRLRCLPTIWR